MTSAVWLTTMSRYTRRPRAWACATNSRNSASVAGMGLRHEFPEFRVRAEMRVDLREVEYPVSVVAGGAVLHGLVLERRRDPDCRGPQPLDVVELRREADEVAPVVMVDAGRVKAARVRPSGDAARVVGRRSVCESIRQHEIEHMTGARMREARHTDLGRRLVAGPQCASGKH